MTEQEKFLEWHTQETANGLIDIKFFVGDGITKTTTSEDFFREANLTNELFAQGKIVVRKEVF